MTRHIARWDLDKTYLRTEFDTLRDLVRTAMERPDEKRTNPGAATLLREMVRVGVEVHILSGSPEQMRNRLEDKLRLDGITWESFTLKPNLRNVLRLRFRALRDQLGYKLPALLRARARLTVPSDEATPASLPRETLFGDDAEADAFVYSLYGDVVSGRVDEATLLAVCERGRMYEDVMAEVAQTVSMMDHVEAVERIFIHLERQTPPDDFLFYGSRVVPFYNYLQAAFVLHEDGRLPSESVLRVATELCLQHRFDGDALARSYGDLARRGHLRGTGDVALSEALRAWTEREAVPGAKELVRMTEALPRYADIAKKAAHPAEPDLPDYVKLVTVHNRRRKK
ncbi:MAG TPA: hypothetical protein VF316_22180 [Polyangiaceae bacterium]